jgi:hypothetical protein
VEAVRGYLDECWIHSEELFREYKRAVRPIGEHLDLDEMFLDLQRVWVRLLVCLYPDGDIPKFYYKRDWAVELIEKARTEGVDSKSYMVPQVVKMLEILKFRR